MNIKLNKLFEASDFEATKEIWLNKGDVFLFEGDDAGKYCYLIKSGRLNVQLTSGTGHETLLYQLQEGELVGELAIFATNVRSATVTADSKTCLLEIEGDAFKQSLERVDFLQKLTAHFLCRYVKTHEVVCRLSQPNIGMKLCHYFLTLADQTNARMDAAEILIRLPSHAMMGKLLSCQRESVTRELKKLIHIDILKPAGKGLYLLDTNNVNLYLADTL
ncbi:MAG: Crp/Fnr family transcriptional regulator [Ghiorsea sp.]|nr:Crp/Fnr family transcriptional regulator [Ghiorsea sp.]